MKIPVADETWVTASGSSSSASRNVIIRRIDIAACADMIMKRLEFLRERKKTTREDCICIANLTQHLVGKQLRINCVFFYSFLSKLSSVAAPPFPFLCLN